MEHMLSDVKTSYIKKFIKPTSVLDVGSGQCLYSLWVKELFSSAQVTAVDMLPAETRENITYVQANLEHGLTSQSDNSFDTVLAFDIIEHIEKEAFFVQELYRVLSQGGVLIGSVPHDLDLFLPQYNLTFNHRSDLTHKRYYTKETLESVLISAGFTPVVIDLRGGINLQIISEFFPRPLRYFVRKTIGLLRRIGIVSTRGLASDIFFVAYKKELVHVKNAISQL